ncbi:hypothetical protein HDU96_010413 [Phlyctochytrium bullatum]|nr:hypothetical protein HDU96_010413 [Phlyctochytrium bullatum]
MIGKNTSKQADTTTPAAPIIETKIHETPHRSTTFNVESKESDTLGQFKSGKVEAEDFIQLQRESASGSATKKTDETEYPAPSNIKSNAVLDGGRGASSSTPRIAETEAEDDPYVLPPYEELGDSLHTTRRSPTQAKAAEIFGLDRTESDEAYLSQRNDMTYTSFANSLCCFPCIWFKGRLPRWIPFSETGTVVSNSKDFEMGEDTFALVVLAAFCLEITIESLLLMIESCLRFVHNILIVSTSINLIYGYGFEGGQCWQYKGDTILASYQAHRVLSVCHCSHHPPVPAKMHAVAALLRLLVVLPAATLATAYNYTAAPTTGLFQSALDLVESKQWCKENAIDCGLLCASYSLLRPPPTFSPCSTWGSCALDRNYRDQYGFNFCNVFVIRAKTGILPWTSWGRGVTRCDKNCWAEKEVTASGRFYGPEEKECVAAADLVLTHGTAEGPKGYENPVGMYEARKCDQITGLSTAALLSARSYIPVGRPRVPTASSNARTASFRGAASSESPATDAPETDPELDMTVRTPSTDATVSDIDTPTTDKPVTDTETPATDVPGEDGLELNAKEPTAEADAPTVDPKTPAADVPATDNEVPAADTPAADTETPATEEPSEDGLELNAKEPTTEDDAPTVDPETPGADTPATEDETPATDASEEGLELNAKEPTTEAEVPTANTETPAADATIPDADAPATDVPVIDAETPATDAPSEDGLELNATEPATVPTADTDTPAADGPTTDNEMPATDAPATDTETPATDASEEGLEVNAKEPAAEADAPTDDTETPATDPPPTDTETPATETSEDGLELNATEPSTVPTADTDTKAADGPTTENEMPATDAPTTDTETPATDAPSEDGLELNAKEPTTEADASTDDTETPAADTPATEDEAPSTDVSAGEEGLELIAKEPSSEADTPTADTETPAADAPVPDAEASAVDAPGSEEDLELNAKSPATEPEAPAADADSPAIDAADAVPIAEVEPAAEQAEVGKPPSDDDADLELNGYPSDAVPTPEIVEPPVPSAEPEATLQVPEPTGDAYTPTAAPEIDADDATASRPAGYTATAEDVDSPAPASDLELNGYDNTVPAAEPPATLEVPEPTADAYVATPSPEPEAEGSSEASASPAEYTAPAEEVDAPALAADLELNGYVAPPAAVDAVLTADIPEPPLPTAEPAATLEVPVPTADAYVPTGAPEPEADADASAIPAEYVPTAEAVEAPASDLELNGYVGDAPASPAVEAVLTSEAAEPYVAFAEPAATLKAPNPTADAYVASEASEVAAESVAAPEAADLELNGYVGDAPAYPAVEAVLTAEAAEPYVVSAEPEATAEAPVPTADAYVDETPGEPAAGPEAEAGGSFWRWFL